MKRDPALLLISPGIIKWTDMDFGLPHLVSIGGYVQEHTGVRVEILDLNYEGGDQGQLARTIEALEPFVAIGISCYSSFDYMRVMALARFLKAKYPNVPFVTGGYHASALPDDVVFDGSPFDSVIPGEGEAPMRKIVESLLGGGEIERVYDKGVVPELDELPPYRWELLNHYWPRAYDIGRKFQIYLSRGCPYRCTFCMERAKSGYKWRAYSPERAVDELKRLSTFTRLDRWVINLADPLFGFNRTWRREVLKGIIENELFPRQYWTLTRSDDLQEEDIELLAKARFSIGIGMEAGSEGMLELMQKVRKPAKYLEAQLRLARLSRKHGLNWAGNIIVGHPGETLQSMHETVEFAKELWTSAPETCGWISIDPFRLYPGSHVHENMAHYEQQYGTKFYHPEWWKSWYDGPFRAEHLDASTEVDFETRVRFMYEHYGPLVAEVSRKFRGQGRSVDRVFERSLREQADLMSDTMRDRVLNHARVTREQSARPAREVAPAEVLALPIGLHVRDESVRERESAVRRLLEHGVLRSANLIEALLTTNPADWLDEAEVGGLFSERAITPGREGEPAPVLGISTYAIAFEQLNPGLGERAIDLLGTRGYVAALFSKLVGDDGEVLVVTPTGWLSKWRLSRPLKKLGNVRVVVGTPTDLREVKAGEFDAAWLGGALPRRLPGTRSLLRAHDGRFVGIIGPRFGRQDLVVLTRQGDALNERVVSRVRAPVIAGPHGWLREPVARAPRPEAAAE